VSGPSGTPDFTPASGLMSAEAVAEDTVEAVVALGEVSAGEATAAVSSGLVGFSHASSL
jgi:hypothetical protein